MEKIKDKPIEWAVLAGSIILIILSVVSPVILYLAGSPIWCWTLHSWEVYLSSLGIAMYTILGVIAWKIRKGETEDET